MQMVSAQANDDKQTFEALLATVTTEDQALDVVAELIVLCAVVLDEVQKQGIEKK